MVDWKTYKGEGPWPFAQQPNKWGYLNNPRWMNPSGAPVSYDGREDEEPQIWSPEGDSNKDGQDDHFPCGHWHKQVPVPSTVPSLDLIPWYCCPQTVVYGNSTTDIFFMTTDHANPTSTLYIIKYNRVTGLWDIVLTDIAINDSVSGYDFRWFEPPVAKARRNNIVAIGATRVIETDYKGGLDLYILNGESLLFNTQIDMIDSSRSPILPFYFSHWLHIDTSGRIHALKGEYISGSNQTLYYNMVSTNNGQSFSPNLIYTDSNYYYQQFITEDDAGDLWAWVGNRRISRSTDGGYSWSYIGQGPSMSTVQDFRFMNNAFFILSAGRIYRATDGITYSIVLTDSTGNGRGGVFGYDGTYYYCIMNFRYSSGNVPGYNKVYRSSDGISWSVVGYFYDDSELGPNLTDSSFDMDLLDGRIVVTYYYASTLYLTYPDVYAMCVWESDDNGVTWNNIQTPFIDLTTGVWPYLPVPLTYPPPSTAAPTPAPTTVAPTTLPPTTLPPTTLAPLSDTWRINVSANNGGSYLNIAEMEMKITLGGADQCSGGTPSASSNGPLGGNPPANAFDNSLVTRWSTNTGLTTGWLQYVFTSDKTIVQYTLSCGSVNLTSHPNTWTLEYWDGGSWQVVDTRTGITWLSVNETKTFNVP